MICKSKFSPTFFLVFIELLFHLRCYCSLLFYAGTSTNLIKYIDNGHYTLHQKYEYTYLTPMARESITCSFQESIKILFAILDIRTMLQSFSFFPCSLHLSLSLFVYFTDSSQWTFWATGVKNNYHYTDLDCEYPKTFKCEQNGAFE